MFIMFKMYLASNFNSVEIWIIPHVSNLMNNYQYYHRYRIKFDYIIETLLIISSTKKKIGTKNDQILLVHITAKEKS